jgi:2-oxoisovalerate dehydrogenase E2 component (dihydrolipoyl transacylase)
MNAAPHEYVFKMPDLGEGTVEAEIVQWYVRVGDSVVEDQPIVEVMTDKASVEVPAPVSGRVLSAIGAPGDKIAVGSPWIVFATGAPSATGQTSGTRAAGATDAVVVTGAAAVTGAPMPARSDSTSASVRVLASPANRRRAREAGVELSRVVGSGPRGRILQSDIVAARNAPQARGGSVPGSVSAAVTETKVIGVRRLIAERMSEAKRTIPHFAYVEEVDVTELEALRQHLNDKRTAEPALSYLPFVVMALVRSLGAHPECNSQYDSQRGVLVHHAAVHVGIATQTPDGLKVPVVRHAERLSLDALAAAIRAVTERARANKSSRDELTGSTITVTSLGKLGGIASTPVINAPEVAIIGLNRAVERPVVQAGSIVVRRIMNLSSSFDHRFVDGYNAASMIQVLKEHLEHPATIFMPNGS